MDTVTVFPITIQGLDICTPYWFVTTSRTCIAETTSAPFKLEFLDMVKFELMFDLEEKLGCTVFIQTKMSDAIDNIMKEMNKTLQSTKCNVDVTCFGESILSCSESKPSQVTFR